MELRKINLMTSHVHSFERNADMLECAYAKPRLVVIANWISHICIYIRVLSVCLFLDIDIDYTS